MNSRDPYATLKAVFAARFGPEALAAIQAGQQAAQASVAAPQYAPAAPAMGGGAMPQGFDPNALMGVLRQSEEARKIILTEQLTSGASQPPFSEQEAAVLLNALTNGGGGAVALGG